MGKQKTSLTKNELVDELNNLEYNYEKEILIEFMMSLLINTFTNLLSMTDENPKSVVRAYLDDWIDAKGKDLTVSVDNMYKAIKEKGMNHPIGHQHHLQSAHKALQLVKSRLEYSFGHVLNASDIVGADGSHLKLVVDKDSDKKPS